MNILLEAGHAGGRTPLAALTTASLPGWLDTQPETTRRWIDSMGFSAQPGSWCGVPGNDGGVAQILAGVAETPDLHALAHLPLALPPGDYVLALWPPTLDAAQMALGFALGAYQYTRYRPARRAPSRLALPAGIDAIALRRTLAACTLVRDLVNTPTEDLGPAQLADAVRQVAAPRGAGVREWVGDELLEANFPAIHAVGRASHRAPRLIELGWGESAHPLLAIVGKGVCFDTGGLDLKTGEGMRWMKKDMGGAAHALALAQWVMDQRLPVRLRLLIPAVENAVGPQAYRPGEVVRTRAGLSVEIDNTDAEGRVVLCDALSYAAEQRPELLLDFATLTGAARVALGPDLPALFANDETLSQAILAAGRERMDPLWPMPLWRPYRAMFESGIADFSNSSSTRHAGAITAALYLERFVPETQPWAHVDVYAWNDADRPGRPRGGEAQGLRAFAAFLAQRYR